MILVPGRNVWRVAKARRAAVLLDGAEYFAALRSAMIKARHSIVIAGWDIHSQMQLRGGEEPKDKYPLFFAEFLAALVKDWPSLDICLLLWDYSMLYAAERDPFPTLTLRWSTPSQIRFCLDDCVPIGSSQHQKLVVIDDALAFSGGLDLTIRRWDTSQHRFDEPGRVDPSGNSYPPFHDVQMVVDGDAARCLGDLVSQRWSCAAYEELPRRRISHDPWPDDVNPDFVDVDIGIARTEPKYQDRAEAREVEQLFLDSIDAAERSIYIENQFLTAPVIAQRLAKRLQERPNLEVLIVSPENHKSWLEAQVMRSGRRVFAEMIKRPGGERVLLVHPQVANQAATVSTMVHSKVMIVDDRILRVGSANLNNRSMGTDTECDLVIVGHTREQRAIIEAQRNRLLGHHCGALPQAVADQLPKCKGSIVRVATSLAEGGHSLVPIEETVTPSEVLSIVQGVADPEKPIGAEEFVSNLLGGYLPTRNMSTVLKVAGAGLLFVALAILWEFVPLADPKQVRIVLASIARDATAPFIVVAIFVIAGSVFFPLTVLIAATAATFGPWLGFLYAGAGALASALVTFALGALIGKKTLHDVLGPRLNRVRQYVVKRGVLAIAGIRLVPIAPFTLVNLVAGASGIPVLDYMLGTLVGILPGLIVISAVGHQFARILTAPTANDLLLLGGAVAAWIAISVGAQVAVSRFWRPSR
ncbi:MAG TPA: VTT domain-containing protein [Pseudolabrys sp.]|nr:VTT domain-containing protein [Pseudolabrys sp.]